MTYNEWEAQLERRLSAVSENEKAGILNYYREIYGDKLDAGLSDEEILAVFGTPDECAERIRKESLELFSAEKKKGLPVGRILGDAAILIFVAAPAVLLVLSALAALCTCVLGGATVSLGGVVFCIYSIVMLFADAAANAVFVRLGLGLAMVGAGVLICVCFYFITRYAVVSLYKAGKYVFEKIKGGRI